MKAWIPALVLAGLACQAHALESAQVAGLGGAGVALTGRGDAFLSNPAHLTEVTAFGIMTGFNAGASFDARPGRVRSEHPDPFRAAMSDGAFLFRPSPALGVAVYGTEIFGARNFRAVYDRSFTVGQYTSTVAGELVTSRAVAWGGGVTAAYDINRQTSVGLGFLGILFEGDTFESGEGYFESTPDVGFTSIISQTFEQTLKGTGFGAVFGARHSLNSEWTAGFSATFVAPITFKETQAIFLLVDSTPDRPDFEASLNLEGEGESRVQFPMNAKLGVEGRPLKGLRVVAEGQLETPTTSGQIAFVVRNYAGQNFFDALPSEFETRMVINGGLGAEWTMGKWSVRLGAREMPSPNPPIDMEDPTPQREHVRMRWGSLGFGYENPYFAFDLAYGYGTGRGYQKHIIYQDGVPDPGVVDTVLKFPIDRRETHRALMSFAYIF